MEQAIVPIIEKQNYSYLPLVGDDLRLISLQPANFNDQISITIFHSPLRKPVTPLDDNRLTKAEIQEAVEEPWEVYETPEGRYFFYLDIPEKNDGIGPTFAYPGSEVVPESYAPRRWNYEGVQYEALSYTWGVELSEKRLQVILQDTSQSLGSLPMLRNLELALRHLRLKDKPRTLWIDAICINQNDLDERSLQVQRMGQIYTQASRVVVWLGPSSKDSQLAVQLLEHYGKQVMIATDYTIFPEPEAENQDWWVDDVVPPYNDDEWSAIVDFIKRPWFERVWTMQEITLANPESIIVCGEDAVKYYHLRRAFLSLAVKAKDHPAIKLLSGRQFIDCGKTDKMLVHLMRLMTKAKCFDPRDKVYGALHIMGPKLRNCITPSYTSPFEDVYKSVFLAYVETTGRLDLLCQRTKSAEPFDAPTWVPDFRKDTKAVDPLPSNFLAAANTKAEVIYDGGSILTVTGLYHDKITAVHSPMNDSDVPRKLRQLSPESLKLSDKYLNGEDTLKAWTRTMCLDTVLERMSDRLSYVMADTSSLQTVLELLLKDAEAGLQELQALSSYEIILECLQEWSFIQTEKGYFGFTHPHASPGDSICVLLGCWAPLVLRPQPDDKWQVIGDCYLHGIMDSETLLGPLPPGFLAQFRVRNGALHPFYAFQTTEDGVPMYAVHDDDPRIGDLSGEWLPQDIGNLYRDADDPVFYMCFYNSETEVMQNHDPRLTPDKLRTRGVPLRTFDLV